MHNSWLYSKSPANKPSSRKLAKMQTCVPPTSRASDPQRALCLWLLRQCSCLPRPSLLQGVRLRACSVDACPWMPAGVLCYCTFCTVRLFSLFFVFVVMSYGSAGKESACNAGDLSSIPGLGRSPGEGKGSPLQYSGLENSMDCIVHGVAKSRTWLGDFDLTFCL